MVVLGLDVATRTGWARLDYRGGAGGFHAEWGALDMNEPTPAAEEPDGVRYRRMADRLPRLLHSVTLVGLEETFSNSHRTGMILHGLMAVILVELERRQIPYLWCKANSLKKWATGDGRATKRDMRRALDDYLGTGVKIADDEVDAFHAARWARDQHRRHGTDHA